MKTYKGILLKDNQLRTKEGIKLVCFYKNFDYDYHYHREIFVGGRLNGDTLIVEEVVIA